MRATEGLILDEPIDDALSSRYLAYSLSTITQRALPDVRDGLKPVHRRILYAMRELKLDPESGFKKCARVVGDVIGRFHPHGDQAVYDALVRLAQDFAQRYRLVDGQGNFGNVDGDSAAAMRYTESRLTIAARLLLEGIAEDTVDFRATYSGEDDEPVVLPAGFPNLLANGSNGIAVGMATSIPPHNAAELLDAAAHLVKFPGASIETLMKFVPGPDFPTGGVIVEPEGARAQSYVTGRGGFRLRSRWEREDLPRGQWQIVVTEIPYQVQKAKLIEKLAMLIETKKLPLLGDVRDESAEDIRLILEPRSRTVDPDVFMESLFALSDLEVRISLNLNVLGADGTPGVLSLRQALQAWLDHRRVVLQRRSQARLRKIATRLEVLSGYIIAFLNLDEVIRIIREEDHPKTDLIAAFDLSETQAEAILNMRLRSLRKLEEMELRREDEALQSEQAALNALLADDQAQWKTITAEIKEAKALLGPKTEGGARRSGFAEAAPQDRNAVLEAMVIKEPLTIVLSEKGWIRALKGHGVDEADIKFKEDDKAAFVLPVQSTDKLVLFATNGKAYTLPCDKLPGGRGHGDPIRLLIDMDESHTPIALFVHEAGAKLLVAATTGHGFILPEDAVIALTKGGKQVLNVSGAVEAILCIRVSGDHLAVVGENRKMLCYPLGEVNEMSRGKGVKLQSYKDGGLADVITFAEEEGLSWTDPGGRSIACKDWRSWLGKRAQAGRMAPRGFPRSGFFSPRKH